MNEKVLIKANFKKNYVTLAFLGVAAVLAAISFSIASDIYLNGSRYVNYGFGVSGKYPYKQIYGSLFKFYFEEFLMQYGWYIIAAAVFAFAAIFLFLLFKCELVVTDKRVYGKAAFGKRIDLPMGKISAISLGAKLFSSIAVATSSGKLQFYLLKNREEVYQTISDEIAKAEPILVAAAPKTDSAPAVSAADELKKYKDLLDSGVITQEEFDAKKKQLLGL